jgi:hypothetical protein
LAAHAETPSQRNVQSAELEVTHVAMSSLDVATGFAFKVHHLKYTPLPNMFPVVPLVHVDPLHRAQLIVLAADIKILCDCPEEVS